MGALQDVQALYFYDQAESVFDSILKDISTGKRKESLGLIDQDIYQTIKINRPYLLYHIGRPEEAIESAYNFLNRSVEEDNKSNICSAAFALGSILNFTWREREALPYTNRAVELSERMGDYQITFNGYLDLSSLYFKLEDYPLSIKSARKAIGLMREDTPPITFGDAYYQLGRALMANGDRDEGLECAKKIYGCIEFTSGSVKLHLECRFYILKAMSEHLEKEYNAGDADFEKVLEISSEDDLSKVDHHIFRALFAKSLLKRGDWVRAKEHLQVALTYYRSKKDDGGVKRMEELLQRITQQP